MLCGLPPPPCSPDACGGTTGGIQNCKSSFAPGKSIYSNNNRTDCGRPTPSGHSSTHSPALKKSQLTRSTPGRSPTHGPCDNNRSRSVPCKSPGTRRMEKTLVPSACGRAARISEPVPRLDTPNAPDVSTKTNSGTGAPDEDFPILRKICESEGIFKKASRVIRKNASNRRAPVCSAITALVVSRAAAAI